MLSHGGFTSVAAGIRVAIPSRTPAAVLARRAPMCHSHDSISALHGSRCASVTDHAVAVLVLLLFGAIARGRAAARVVVPGIPSSFRRMLLLYLVLLGCLLLSRQKCGLMQVDMRLAKGSVAVSELRCAI